VTQPATARIARWVWICWLYAMALVVAFASIAGFQATIWWHAHRWRDDPSGWWASGDWVGIGLAALGGLAAVGCMVLGVVFTRQRDSA